MTGHSRAVGRTLIAVGILGLAGCGEPTGDFGASLAGPLEGTVRGEAVFCPRPERGDFVLLLRDPRSGAAFELRREETSIPAPGSYGVLGTVGERRAAVFRFVPHLAALEGGEEYNYRVDGGKVRIISADSSRISGRFEAEMVATDASPEIDVSTGMVRVLPTEAMTVSGQFSAVRAERCELP